MKQRSVNVYRKCLLKDDLVQLIATAFFWLVGRRQAEKACDKGETQC